MCYGLYDDDEQIGFIGVLHFPHPNNPKIKAVSRLVILPDYQGIGLGRKFLNIVADIYTQKGFDFMICTSAKNLIMALKRDNSWSMTRYGKASLIAGTGIQSFNKTSSFARFTASFFKKRV